MTRRGLQIRRHSEIEREIKHVRTATAAHLACIRSARPKVQYRVLLGSHCPLRSSVRACIGPSEAERCTEQRNTSGRETAALMEQSDGCSVRNGARKIHTSRRGPRSDGTNRALFFHASHTHTHTHAAGRQRGGTRGGSRAHEPSRCERRRRFDRGPTRGRVGVGGTYD